MTNYQHNPIKICLLSPSSEKLV